jgi:N-acetylneuraminic acid mutarotase
MTLVLNCDVFLRQSMILIVLIVLLNCFFALLFLSPATSTSFSSVTEMNSSWSNVSSMPTPRSESGVAILGDKIYVVGGESYEIKKTNVVEVYDISTNKWSTAAPLPKGMNHIALSPYNGKLYGVGGTHENGYSNKLYIYDPEQDKWSEGKSMPGARTALTVNFIDGKLYAVGGVDDVHNVMNTNLVYDPANDSWTEMAPMPTSRHHPTSSVVDGKLYVIGGRLLGNGIPRPINEGLSNLNDNEMYDPATNTWTILEQMPTKRSGLASASIGNNIYVFGGQKVNGTYGNTEIFDTINNNWTSDTPLPTPRLGLEAIAIGNDIYVIGGKTWYAFGGEVEVFHTK